MVKRKYLFSLILLVLLTGCQLVSQGDTADMSGSDWYDIDSFGNQTTLVRVLKFANENYLQNWWGNLTLLGLFVVMFTVFKSKYETKKALLVSSFMCTVVAIFFRILGLVPEQVVLIGIVLTAGTLISTLFGREY